MLAGRGLLFPQPGTEPLAPGWPVLVGAEFLGHRLTRFGQGGSGPFVPDPSQWSQIGADGEDDGSGTWEAGKSVMFDTQKGSQRVKVDPCGWTVVWVIGICALEWEK